MKTRFALAFPVLLVFLVIVSGCTGTPPASQPAATSAPVQAPATVAAAAQSPYPDAVPVNSPLAFGSGAKTGELTVTAYKVVPTVFYVDPSLSSPRQQLQSSNPLDPQPGNTTFKPAEGNTFVLIYLTAAGTGTESAWAPAPNTIALYSDGTMYHHKSLPSAKSVIQGEASHMYDYWYSDGDTKGAVLPGKANNVKGFLIYEVPAAFAAEKSFVVASLYSDKQGAWKLV